MMTYNIQIVYIYMSDSEQVKILKEQLQQANNLINQLVASNNALAASAVAGAVRVTE